MTAAFPLEPRPVVRRRAATLRARRGMASFALALLACGVAWPATASARHVGAAHERHAGKHRETGLASFYGPDFNHRRTASGERFDPNQLTAAHRSLPFGTRVKVTNLDNGRHVVVRINDRGPFARGRVLDVSRAAARKLGFLQQGVAHVRLEVLRDRSGAGGRLADDVSAPRREPGRAADPSRAPCPAKTRKRARSRDGATRMGSAERA